MQLPPSPTPTEQLEKSAELIHELEILADINERRALAISVGIAILAALLLPLVSVLIGIDFADRTLSFWFGSLLIELLVVFAAWYSAVMVIAPPRSNMEKMMEAIGYAAANPISVSLSQSGQQITIHLRKERVTLTGAEAKLFRKHWRGES